MKLAVLLSPFRLGAGEYFVDALHIEKKNGVPGYDIKPLTQTVIAKQFEGVPLKAKALLEQFTHEALGKAETVISQQISKQRAGVDREQYIRKAMLRHAHQLLNGLLPYADTIKWYCQRQQRAGKHFILAPCTLHQQKPLLFFDVVREDHGGLGLP